MTGDSQLAAALAEEDRAEDRGTLAADDRRTCHTHRSWAEDCESNPLHVRDRVGAELAGRTLAVLQAAR